MEFEAKLRVIGNSQGIYIPKGVITDYKIGDIITLEVITRDKAKEVITGSLLEKKPVIVITKVVE